MDFTASYLWFGVGTILHVSPELSAKGVASGATTNQRWKHSFGNLSQPDSSSVIDLAPLWC